MESQPRLAPKRHSESLRVHRLAHSSAPSVHLYGTRWLSRAVAPAETDVEFVQETLSLVSRRARSLLHCARLCPPTSPSALPRCSSLHHRVTHSSSPCSQIRPRRTTLSVSEESTA